MGKTDNFAEKAAEWDEDPKKIAMTNRYVEEVLKFVDIQPDWKMMEIGTGTGLVGLQLLPKVKSAVLEDTSESMLSMLKQKLTSAEKEKAEVFFGEVTDYQTKDIDLVVSTMAFHHIEDIDATLKHLFNIIKPNGVIVIGDIRTEDGSFHRFQPIPHKGFDTDKLSASFENTGFKVKNVHTYNILKREREQGVISEYEQFLLLAYKESK